MTVSRASPKLIAALAVVLSLSLPKPAPAGSAEPASQAPQPEVVGGEPAGPNDNSFQVALLVKPESNNRRPRSAAGR